MADIKRECITLSQQMKAKKERHDRVLGTVLSAGTGKRCRGQNERQLSALAKLKFGRFQMPSAVLFRTRSPTIWSSLTTSNVL